MANKLVGQNYTTPDLVAKVTGQAKYAEDFRVDGMLFCKLLLSPYPHARVTRIDASRALAMPGVKGILTADQLPPPADVVTDLGQTIKANTRGEKALTNEPVYQGEPVLAVAAVDELAAVEAIEQIEVSWEMLPFAVDPVKSLLPGGANARLEGNVWGKPKPASPGQPVTPPAIENLKWTATEAAEYARGRLPMGPTPDEWSYGDVESGFKNAALVLDETFVTPNTSHQTLEPRTAMAYCHTGKNLPWSCVSGGSQTTHAHTRAAHAAATDAIKKLQEIAAKAHGGTPAQYTVANERVSGPGGSMTLAQAAQKAIDYGGTFDGHELPENINAFTKASASALAGQGLMGVARDTYPHDGATHSFVAGFAEVEVDLETGKYHIVDYLAVADVGTVIHPRALGGQVLGRSMLGIGHAIGQHWVYDQHYGLPLAKRFHHNKPPTILDAPRTLAWDAVNLPDPETPVGARGIGEPPVAAGCCAVLNALADALGDDVFRRAPVMAGTLLAALEAGHPVQEPLTAHL